jgi:hypothetical protein
MHGTTARVSAMTDPRTLNVTGISHPDRAREGLYH